MAVVVSVLALSWSTLRAEMTAPVTAVVLYPGSATVVRTAQLGPGSSRLVITGLSPHLDRQTLRAEAGPGIQVGEMVIEETATLQAVNPAEAELESKIQLLQDQLAVLDAEAKSAEIVKAYLERFGSPGSPTDQPLAVADGRVLGGILDTLGRGAQDVLAKLQRIGVKKRDLGKKVDALQRDLARLRTGAKDSLALTVNLLAERPGTVKISYQVNHAGWKPAYRASLDSAASRLELERLATISQKTGEDWHNVKLSLSTVQPKLSPEGRSPQPWLLSYSPPQKLAEARAGGFSAYAAAPAAARAMADKQEAAYKAPTFETNSAFATEFEVPTRLSLASDGRETAVALARQTLPVRQEIRVAPRLDRTAYVSVEAERPLGVWIPGNVQLYRDGNYVGAIQWDPQAGERFVMPFGRDDLLRVAVNPLQSLSGATGLLEKHNERRLADQFVLTSAHKSAVDLLVLESSPVSTSDEIKTTARFDPPPTSEAWEQRRGVVAWKKTLAPAETASFKVEYKIEYPQEGSIYGLR
ncbi:MAG: mucoidy inhibitor MuiA family protein [Rhodocyclales bacterium GT-UBC]|nr:MAG: mucoidy inhibitor MuiA family protein [Rhodocyclales bacterium GT-UBC]